MGRRTDNDHLAVERPMLLRVTSAEGLDVTLLQPKKQQ